MSNITLNIVAPDTPTPTPVDPGIDPSVSSTGLFTHGIGSSEATIIAVSTILLLAIVALVVFAILYKKKTGKSLIRNNKHITTAVILLAILASTGTFIALARNAALAADTDEEANDETGLTVDVSSEELTIEVGSEPVFAVLPVDVTVAEGTIAGYTLTASTTSTDLVSTTDSSNIIPMVAAEDPTLLPLSANTYGFSLVEPESKDSEVYTSLSADSSSPTILKATDYVETPANDTTTIYYGFYITPDTPYGTYTGSTISYEAIPSLATISYDAHGLYYNNDESFTTNIVGYKPSTPDSPIEELTGEYLTPAPLEPSDSSNPSSPIHYTFLGWSKTEGATTPDYEDEEDIIANLTLSPNEDLTLHAVWHYNTVLSFNGNGGSTTTPMLDRTIPAGTTEPLPANTYTKTGSVFLGWNTVKDPTPDNPGRTYEDGAPFTAPEDSQDITLYAQWAYTTNITFDGNGETSGTMNPQTIVAGTPEALTPNTFTKTNATFIGWNTERNPSSEHPGRAYADQAEFEADTTAHQDITLYAQWAYTTINFNGNYGESGSGSMSSITIAGGTTTTLPQSTFTNPHCNFTSWNTNADGSGTRYPGEAQYEASLAGVYSFTLYAQWQCESMVNFYGNGATSGEMGGIMATGGEETTLPANKFAKEGYSFNGWNTKLDGSGDSYPDQGTYVAPRSESITLELYAQWAGTTITFSSNGGSGTMSDVTIPAGTSANLPQNTFTRTGYVFNGWNTKADGSGDSYSDQDSYYATAGINNTITLHAQWLPTTTITFNGNGGSGTMSPQTIVAGTPQNLSANTYTKEGYVFNGWNTSDDGMGTSYADKASYSASTAGPDSFTLYAQWKVPTLYDKVAAMSKGTQTAAQLKAVITKPASSDPSVDTSNSGVYKYDATVFGAASDASSNYDIYYYRGILDSNLNESSSNSYGSNGDGAYYPNYVKLGDTCWRIVRTTGSGGVKMIYNGLYSSGTTANSCANAQANAQVTTKEFNGDSTTYQQSVRLGYTYNSTYATNTAQTASIANVFGSDANPSVNNTDSTIKDYIEDEWFTSAIGSYESKLEPSAGYCNDRTVYDNTSPYTQQAEDTNIVTYGTSGLDQLHFGSYVRNQIANGTRTLTLGCARSIVDLYTTSAATNGNKQLSHPVALLTADEAALAGSGGNGRTSPATQSSNYSYSSYMRSGLNFWLLSPAGRHSRGNASDFDLASNGTVNYNAVRNAYGVRPSISLNHETTVKSGTGTATDPWIINE